MQSFLYDKFGRLRSGWRFTFFFGAFILLAMFVGISSRFVVLAAGLDPKTHFLALTILSLVLSLASALLVGWACGKLFEELPFKALGASFTGTWLRDISVGLVIGALAVCIAVSVAMLAGDLTFRINSDVQGSEIANGVLMSLAVFAVGAAFEEAFARGYMFQTFVRSKLAWLALLLTSFIFASGHIGNPSSGSFSFVNTFLAGIWLGLAYLRTRTLWFPFGIHLAWNFVLGSVFGIEVSGLTRLAEFPILKEIDKGPAWITGGNYGLEGGIACTVALLLAILLVWYGPFLRPDKEMVRLSSPPEALDEDPA